MATSFWIVDTLSRELLRGHPAAVFFVEDFCSDDLLQNISMEINTTETIFVKKVDADRFLCKCFTSNYHGMDFGNGLFAAAKVINSQNLSLMEFRIIVDQKDILIQILSDGAIKMKFESANVEKAVVPTLLHSALAGKLIVSVAKCDLDLIVEIRSPKKLLNLSPDVDMFKRIHHYNSFIITTDTHYETDLDYDFCARVFAPKFGLFRDVLTPLAGVKLATYWSGRMGKNDFIGFQSSRERNCYINLSYGEDYTFVTGYCAISTEGQMAIF
ncbi:MAG: PhzF family phenazine biosynthesis protein [Holosporales bacterium]|jgi:PhzF family phenazine biosynthesis protein|nr:PhzF family phenazine biosynthesis protein [Holosporales bacterium]